MEQGIAQAQSPAEASDLDALYSEIKRNFDGRPDELISILQRVQRSAGYLPEKALLAVADFTGLPAASVYGVATFYAQFRLSPAGKHVVRVCQGTACHVKGAKKILEELNARLEIEPGETTADRAFTLQTVACFGSCALAPVVVLDEAVHGRMDPSKVREMLGEIQRKEEHTVRGETISA
jgi:NADH:ubiquinone oxidoreductase subunit E